MDGAIWILKVGETLPPVKAARGDFEDWIAAGLGLGPGGVAVARVHAGDPLPDAGAVAGVVVTGSPGMVTDREDWSEAAAGWLADLVERDAVPVLGICYGHQLIAHGLGGRVARNPRGREMGTVQARLSGASLTDDPLLQPGSYPVHMSHLESVVVAPSGARALGETDLEPHVALRFGPRQWGVQFHPEFDRDIMQRYLEARRDVLAQEGFDPHGLVEATRETPEAAALLGRFARLVQEAGA